MGYGQGRRLLWGLNELSARFVGPCSLGLPSHIPQKRNLCCITNKSIPAADSWARRNVGLMGVDKGCEEHPTL